jgi:hypothetical protein
MNDEVRCINSIVKMPRDLTNTFKKKSLSATDMDSRGFKTGPQWEEAGD